MAINIVRIPEHITKSFDERYGKVGEHLDEDTWLAWFGIWYSAWGEAMRYIPQLTQDMKSATCELEDLIAQADQIEKSFLDDQQVLSRHEVPD